ncbi:MAG: hypothetical protein ABSE22_11235 [Xanthobacteraceae bacterium]|jgi:hypothetical protein
MKSLNVKLALSALGIVAMLTSPALAKKAQPVTQESGASSTMIPGYDRDGGVVGIPNPDQAGAQSQR